jgi:PPOX class probable F420-dependent enzyme
MDDDEVVTFLEALPARTGKLATVRADGRPHVAPVWFALDASTRRPGAMIGGLVLHTGANTVKARNIAREPRVALCVDDDRPPFTFVTIDGVATVSEDPDELLHWATVLGGRYMGADRAAAFGDRNGVPGELLIRVRPTAIVAFAGLSD